MKIVVIGGIGHIAYALNGIQKNPKTLKLCGFSSAVPGDMPEFFAAYEAVQNGAVGDIAMLYGRKSYYFNSSRPDFYRRRETYGGTILWVAVHALDWFCWFAGNVSEIYATQTVKGNKGYGECEAAAAISMHFFGDFCRSLRGEGQCRLTMEDTFQVSRTALLARESADFHKLIII